MQRVTMIVYPRQVFLLVLPFLIFIRFVSSCDTVYTCLDRGNNGFSNIVESPTTQKIYVSSSTGDDSNDGLSPSTPVKTQDAGIALLRDGYPDWLLFQRGDEFSDAFGHWGKGGSNASLPMVIASYGNRTLPRPKFLLNAVGMSGWSPQFKHVVITDVELSGEQKFDDDAIAFRFLGPVVDVLIEDVVVKEAGSIFQKYPHEDPDSFLRDIVLRRCQFYESYPRGGGHSQGIYGHGVERFIMEENLFYQNGWTRNPVYWNNEPPGGNATMFNHNIYFNWLDGLTVRKNLFFRGASSNIKFRSDHSREPTLNLVVDDNLFWGGEVGVSLGGNTNEKYRFIRNDVTNNVFSDVGETIPENGWKSYTGRMLSFILDLQDHANTNVMNNIIIKNPYTRNGYGIVTIGSMKNIRIENNILRGLKCANFLALRHKSTWEGYFYVNNNVVVNDNGLLKTNWTNTKALVEYNLDQCSWHSVSFENNSFFADEEDMNNWFSLGDNTDVQKWLTKTNSKTGKNNFPHGERNFETYCQEVLNFQESTKNEIVEKFIALAKQQSRDTWRDELMAVKINDYIREGFAMEYLVDPPEFIKDDFTLAIIVGVILGSVVILVLIAALVIVLVIGLAIGFLKGGEGEMKEFEKQKKSPGGPEKV